VTERPAAGNDEPDSDLARSGPPSILSPAQDILTGLRVGYMATLRADGRIAVVPVGVVRDGDGLRISSPAHTVKIRNLERDPRITVCVPDPQDGRRYVEIRGTAELVDDTDRSFVNWIAREFMGVDEYPYEPPSVQRKIIVVHPERVSMPGVHGSGRR
jgi:PPOX class probable F420-dependent enzyme